jgi:hypothetical protein
MIEQSSNSKHPQSNNNQIPISKHFGFLNHLKLFGICLYGILSYFFSPPIFPKSIRGIPPPETCGKIPFHFSMLFVLNQDGAD